MNTSFGGSFVFVLMIILILLTIFGIFYLYISSKNKERIDKILQYTIDNFQEPVTLDDVAGSVAMSVPAVCNYFKKSTKKTYIDFLNEVRVGYACKQLIDTQNNIASICYDSGFNTLANFNKQFLKVKKLTPSVYRKTFMDRESFN